MIRRFERDDLPAVAAFCARARAVDPLIEPFGDALPALATSPRALVDRWRVALDGAGVIRGIAFAAERDSAVAELYVAVEPAWRRQGLGAALALPSLAAGLKLRARTSSAAGIAFLESLHFTRTGAQLQLKTRDTIRISTESPSRPTGATIVRRNPDCVPGFLALANEAWEGAPEAFSTRAEEVAALVEDEQRLLLVAEVDRRAVGYLTALRLGPAIAIEEVAVLPAHRRRGIARALVGTALRDANTAVLTVAESNEAARALYRSLGFVETARRLIYER